MSSVQRSLALSSAHPTTVAAATVAAALATTIVAALCLSRCMARLQQQVSTRHPVVRMPRQHWQRDATLCARFIECR